MPQQINLYNPALVPRSDVFGGRALLRALGGVLGVSLLAWAVAEFDAQRVAAHARSAEAVKRCLHFGVTILYHATLLDQEAKDMLSAVRDTVWLPPMHEVTVAFDAGNPGTWAFHCHHLYHMATGVMTTVEYVS